MRDLILFSNFFADVDQTTKVISEMEFKDGQYGEQIPEFNMISPEHDRFFKIISNEPVEILENSGVFRKPYTTIHFEDFIRESAWVCAVALEENEFNIWKHIEKNSSNVFNLEQDVQEFINENCFDLTKWEKEVSIKLKPNQVIFFKPWMWHNFEHSNLMQFFYLKYNQEEKQEDNNQEAIDTNGVELQDSE